MSGVFSAASHCVLQYLPDVVAHEQTGCAHLSPSAVAIFNLRVSGSVASSSSADDMQCDYACLPEKAHIPRLWIFADDSSIQDSLQISATVTIPVAT